LVDYSTENKYVLDSVNWKTTSPTYKRCLSNAALGLILIIFIVIGLIILISIIVVIALCCCCAACLKGNDTTYVVNS
jgi:hypothetical protein